MQMVLTASSTVLQILAASLAFSKEASRETRNTGSGLWAEGMVPKSILHGFCDVLASRRILREVRRFGSELEAKFNDRVIPSFRIHPETIEILQKQDYIRSSMSQSVVLDEDDDSDDEEEVDGKRSWQLTFTDEGLENLAKWFVKGRDRFHRIHAAHPPKFVTDSSEKSSEGNAAMVRGEFDRIHAALDTGVDIPFDTPRSQFTWEYVKELERIRQAPANGSVHATVPAAPVQELRATPREEVGSGLSALALQILKHLAAAGKHYENGRTPQTLGVFLIEMTSPASDHRAGNRAFDGELRANELVLMTGGIIVVTKKGHEWLKGEPRISAPEPRVLSEVQIGNAIAWEKQGCRYWSAAQLSPPPVRPPSSIGVRPGSDPEPDPKPKPRPRQRPVGTQHAASVEKPAPPASARSPQQPVLPKLRPERSEGGSSLEVASPAKAVSQKPRTETPGIRSFQDLLATRQPTDTGDAKLDQVLERVNDSIDQLTREAEARARATESAQSEAPIPVGTLHATSVDTTPSEGSDPEPAAEAPAAQGVLSVQAKALAHTTVVFPLVRTEQAHVIRPATEEDMWTDGLRHAIRELLDAAPSKGSDPGSDPEPAAEAQAETPALVHEAAPVGTLQGTSVDTRPEGSDLGLTPNRVEHAATLEAMLTDREREIAALQAAINPLLARRAALVAARAALKA